MPTFFGDLYVKINLMLWLPLVSCLSGASRARRLNKRNLKLVVPPKKRGSSSFLPSLTFTRLRYTLKYVKYTWQIQLIAIQMAKTYLALLATAFRHTTNRPPLQVLRPRRPLGIERNQTRFSDDDSSTSWLATFTKTSSVIWRNICMYVCIPWPSFFFFSHQWRRKLWNIGEAQGGYFFFGLIFIAYLSELRKWPLLVNQKYWGGSSLTGLTVSVAPDFLNIEIHPGYLSEAIDKIGEGTWSFGDVWPFVHVAKYVTKSVTN